MEKIHVLHLIYSLATGGAEKVVENYAKFHDRAFFEPVVCSLTSGGFIAERIKISGTEVIMLNKRKGFDIIILPRLIKVIRSRKIRIVHLHNFSANFWGTIAAVLCRVPVIFRTEHNVVIKEESLLKKIKYLINYTLGYFQKKIISVSEKVKFSHIENDFLFPNKYITVYNGIDPGVFEQNQVGRNIFGEFNINESYSVVLKIASLTIQKGHEYFLKAAKLVLNRYSEVVFMIVGDGPRRHEVECFTDELGIKKNIIFTGVREDIPALLGLSDIFVLSSLWEGFPITILEAMAASKPIVATDVGGNSEAIIDGITGFLVPPKDEKSLAESILYLLRNKNIAKEMGEKGRDRFEREFSAKIMVKKTEILYESFLKI